MYKLSPIIFFFKLLKVRDKDCHQLSLFKLKDNRNIPVAFYAQVIAEVTDFSPIK